jgi:hypothetical protein
MLGGASCAFGVDVDGLFGASTLGVDAGPSDARPSDAGPSCSIPNLLLNPGFESDLSDWSLLGNGAYSRLAESARSGGRGVRLCLQGPETNPYAGRYVYQRISRIQTEVYFRAWIRGISPDAATPQGRFGGVSLSAFDSPGDEQRNERALDTTWQCISVKAPLPTTDVAVYVRAETQGTVCVDVDDLYAAKVPEGGLPAECQCP